MATCPDCGMDHHPEAAEAALEADAAEALAVGEVEAVKAEGSADVRVAEIEAQAAVELAKINAKVEAGWQEARVAELEGVVAGMREVIDRMTAPPEPPADPEPAPAPVEVVDDGPPAPEDNPAPPKAEKKSKGWWG